MAKEIKIRAVVDTSEAVDNVDDLNKEIDKTSDAVGGLSGSIDKFTGGAITAFKSFTKGAKSAIASMFTLKGAIIATGIGALVVVVGTLVSYFTNTQRGADKVDQAFAVMGATIDVLIDRVSSFGEGLFKILSGDFKGGVEALTGSFSGITAEIQKEAGAALDLEKSLKILEDREIAFIKVQAEKEKVIAAARLAAEDAKLTDEERADALREGIKLEKEIADQQIEFAKERARIIRERVALGESSREDIREQAEAEANVLRLETARDTALKSIQTRLNAFTKGTKDNTAAIKENIEAKEEERRREIDPMGVDLSSADQIKLMQNQMLNDMLLKQNEIFADEDFDITKKLRKKKTAEEQIAFNNRMDMAQMGFAILTNLAKKGSAESKGIAIAQVLFDTYRGIQGAFASATRNPVTGAFPAYPFIQAAAAASFGFANVKAIMSTKPSGGSGGGGASVPRGGASVGGGGDQPQVVPNIEAINNGVGGTQNAGLGNVRAYIVQEDQKDSSALNQRLEDLQSA